MITGAIAKEQIQDRVRSAELDRRSASLRRMRTRRGVSGLLASVLGGSSARRSADEAPGYRVRTA